LAAAASETEILSKDLAERNEIIATKKVVVTGLIEEVTAKAEIAEKDSKAAAIKKDQLDKDSVIIAREEAEAAESLKAATPALEAAKEALKEVNSSDIAVVKNLAAPADIVKEVCAITYYLYPKTNLNDSSWPAVKSGLLGDMRLVTNL
jgi:dynein heavy chain